MATALGDGPGLRGTVAELEAVLSEAERRGLVPPAGFRSFVERHNPTLLDFEHVPRLVSVAERIAAGELDRTLVLMPPRYFKALADDTPIPTPAGWKPIGDLRVGDAVFAGDGTPTRVIGVQRWSDRETYRVRTCDGYEVLADADHRWYVRDPWYTDSWRVRRTEDMARRDMQRRRAGKRARPYKIPAPPALKLPEAELPVPPYTLGAWLGDGGSRDARITIGAQDETAIRAHIEADGYTTEPHAKHGTATFAILGSGGRWDRATSLTTRLRSTNLLQNKHIPEPYFRASYRQRLALLQGLMDTDGTVSSASHRQATFGNMNRRLAKDVQHLLHTLGVKANFTEYRSSLDGEDRGPAFAVTFHMEGCARLDRKVSLAQDATPHNQLRSLRFEPGPRRDTTCIAVAHPSQLFLAGRGYLVTHNTEAFSRLLGAHFLRRHPEARVGLASYGAELAWDISEEARTYFEMDGGRLKSSTHGKKHWKTEESGEMWAAGVGGPMLGFGYDLGIVDDPTDPRKAHSPTYQRRFRRWWPSKFLSRQEPGAQIVVVMQRLGPDDPVDFLLRREVGDDTEAAPQHWHVVVLDEIKSTEPLGPWDGPMGLPETCTLEPDDRDPGSVLAPSRFDADQVSKMQSGAASFVSSAQRQQRPMEPRGDFWRKGWFRTYRELPPDAYDGGKDWDTAYTKDEANSASAYVESYRGPGPDDSCDIYIHDVGWAWKEFPELVSWMQAKAGPHYVEQKASGKSAAQALRRQGLGVEEVTVEGDKFARAAAVQPVASNRRVHVREAVLDDLLRGDRQGLLRITTEQLQADGPGLDLNDAFVQALHRHTASPKKKLRSRSGASRRRRGR